MAEDRSRNLFRSFWKRSVDKTPPIVFLPPNATSHTSDPGPSEKKDEGSGLTGKQLRRAQVRKAQKEHRLRKQNYVKHLEQDVIDLRNMIAAIHKEAASIQIENDGIKTILWSNNLPGLTFPAARHDQLDQPLGSNGSPLPLPSSSLGQITPYQDLDLGFGTSVTIDFDSIIDGTCLQIHHTPDDKPEIAMNVPNSFNFPANNFTDGSQGTNRLPHHSDSLPNFPQQSQSPLDLETAEIAVNFILALEHPCRTHFHPIPSEFDPKGFPTGHELMASTSFYASAPSHIFTAASEVSWNISSSPVTELHKLREMNESLPKRDCDITPVQAWFLLLEKYDLGELVGNEDMEERSGGLGEGEFLGKLKRGLATLVDCFGFGAVMDKLLFWEVVEQLRRPVNSEV